VRAVVFTGAGGNEVVRLEERPDPVPGDDEVLVAASFAGLNPADLAQRAGNYPAPPGSPADVPGLEVAGTVVRCGAAVRQWSEGDAVFGIVGGGGLADRVVVHERHVARVPGRLDAKEAAAVPEVFITAHDAVVVQAGLGLGDVLLVNGANGGVGIAALQLAVAAGARAFGCLRSTDAHARIEELGAQAVAPDEAVDRVRAAGGADVVLELVGAQNVPVDLEALALKGRVLIVGTGAGADAAFSLRALMGKRARLIGTGLRVRPLEEKAAAVQAFVHEVVPLLADGRVRPFVDRVFAADGVTDAFDHLAAPGKFGKVLIEFA